MQRHFKIILFVAIIIIPISLVRCDNLQNDYQQIIGKKIILDDISDSSVSIFTIVYYLNHEGCTPCKLQPNRWNHFINMLDSLANVRVFFILESDSSVFNEFDLPIYYDSKNVFFYKNNLPSDPRFHCFLLDENNKVILIGNPVQNPKIKELYLRTICERLGIEYNQNSDAKMDSKTEINLGSFPKSESKSVQFFIPNNTESEMQIDTVFTSCECTTAKIDKISISPHQNASLSVTYTPDGSGEFFREVYVKVRGEDKPKTFAIRGNVE